MFPEMEKQLFNAVEIIAHQRFEEIDSSINDLAALIPTENHESSSENSIDQRYPKHVVDLNRRQQMHGLDQQQQAIRDSYDVIDEIYGRAA